MSSKTTNGLVKSLLAPLSGQVISLEQVPDEVFSQKILGDGIAIIPTDGKLYAPVDGEIASVAETLHAYGFTGADGLEILVHVGLDSVKLKGEGFKSHVQVGEKVTAGQLVAEVDLQYLESQGVPTITPVLICEGAENVPMGASSGTVTAGKDTVIKLGEETTAEEHPVAEEPEKKPGINFDFLQKLGKVLMTVIAVMPAAGIMLSLGKLLQMADLGLAITVGSTMENIGWAIITNLHILFAAAIGGSWAKERAGGAFAAVISFILINRITGAVFGVTTDMLTTPGATVNSFFGQEMLVENYFTNILGSPALNMGVFVGIIAGFVGGDTVGCMVSTRFDQLEELTLMIDIGTNGEMVLGNKNRRIACSTAAGPAFEGAKISCGMRGAEGAVDHVEVKDGKIEYHVIGDGEAIGLCGSGLLDLVASLLETEILDESGYLEDDEYVLCEKVTLTQKDVREVQLAKAAIRAGIELLAQQMGVQVSDIQKVYLAGAFGNYLNPASACRIGMIPPILLDRIEGIGNAAGEGSKLCALSRNEYEYSQNLARGTEFLELASLPQFQDCYVDALEFSEDNYEL